MYNCKIVADSINTFGNRITTFELTYPRIVHAELMTHRLFSRNAASSRAIPVRKMIESVKNNMFTPLAIQKAHKGMQGTDYFEGVELEKAKQLWIESAELAIQQAEKMEKFGISKQIVNRVVEPYQYYQVLVTATEWDNFFELRCPKYYYEPENKYFKSKKDYSNYWFECFGSGIEEVIEGNPTIWWLKINKSQAEIHIQAIAELMWDEINSSTPKQLKAGEWHIPNLGHEWDDYALLNLVSTPEWLSSGKKLIDEKIKVAAAHCAKISYDNFGTKIDYEADIRLHDRLLAERHMSPMEHCAVCKNDNTWYANFKGWQSYRNILGF